MELKDVANDACWVVDVVEHLAQFVYECREMGGETNALRTAEYNAVKRAARDLGVWSKGNTKTE